MKSRNSISTHVLIGFLALLISSTSSAISLAQEKSPDYPDEEFLRLIRSDTVGVRIHDLSSEILNGEWDAIRTYNAGVWPTKYWPLMLVYNKTGFKLYGEELFYGGRVFEVLGIEFFMIDTWEYLRNSKSIVPHEIGLSNDSLRLARVRTVIHPTTGQQKDSVDFVFLLSSDTSFVFETTAFVKRKDSTFREAIFSGQGEFLSIVPSDIPIYKLGVTINSSDSRVRFKVSVPSGRTLLDTVLSASAHESVILDLLGDEPYVYSIRIDVIPIDKDSAAWTIRLCPDCGVKPTRYKYQKYW